MDELLTQLKGVVTCCHKLVRQLNAYRDLLLDPIANAYRREKELADLGRLADSLPDSELRRRFGDWQSRELESVGQHKDDFRFEFGGSLLHELDQVGLRIRGQLPTLKAGMFTLKVDLASGSATVFWGPEVERLKSGIRLVPAELARTLRKWTDELRERATDQSLFRRQLADAYRRAVLVAGLTEGSRIPLHEVLAELVMLRQPKGFRADPARTKFAEYPRVRFSYDLYRMKASVEAASEEERFRLLVATFDATTDKVRSLWVPDNDEGEGTYYSHVSVGRHNGGRGSPAAESPPQIPVEPESLKP